MPGTFVELIGALLEGTGSRLIAGNKLTPSQPPLLVWGFVESDTESPITDETGDGFALSWTVAHSGSIEQVPLAILDLDPHLSHDESGTVETLTPRRGDLVLMVRNADGILTMIGKAEGISDG